jgi:hypothetical protein
VVLITFWRRVLKQRTQPKATTLQVAGLQEKRTILQRRITTWRQVQSFYMPGVLALRGTPERLESESLHPENLSLHLPSGFPASHTLSSGLVDMEKRLRLAQAEDALSELRRLLRVTLGLWDYKFSQLGPSQRANTRARSMIARFEDKIGQCVERYRAAWSALGKLDPTGSWMGRFLELKAEHVKGPGRGRDEESEGRREVSWIWMMRAENQDGNMKADEEEIGDSE